MKSVTKTRWIVAATLLAIYVAWALLVIYIFINRGDQMIAFDPVLMIAFSGIILGAITAVVLLICRQWQVALALCLGVLTLILAFRNGDRVEDAVWQRTIKLHEKANETAMATIQSKISGEDLFDVWENEKLTPLNNFHWYRTNDFSAPHGTYFGFRINGVPHVRIQKIRHGWKGIALVHSEPDLKAAETQYGITYSRIGESDWFTWSF